MSEDKVISIRRSVAIGAGVAVLLLAGLGYYFFIKAKLPSPNDQTISAELSSPDDRVEVIQEPVVLPGFKEKLEELGVRGLILVVGDGKIKVITPDGTPIDLCGLGSKTDKGTQSCEVTTSASAMVRYISDTTQALANGYCSKFGGGRSDCHKDTRKWRYHADDTGKSHQNCDGACQ